MIEFDLRDTREEMTIYNIFLNYTENEGECKASWLPLADLFSIILLCYFEITLLLILTINV